MHYHFLLGVLVCLGGCWAKMLLVETQGTNNSHKGYLLKTKSHKRLLNKSNGWGVQKYDTGVGTKKKDRGVQKILAR